MAPGNQPLIRSRRPHSPIWHAVGCIVIPIVIAAVWFGYYKGAFRALPESPEIDFALSPVRDEMVFVGAGQGGSDLFVLDLMNCRVSRLFTSPDMEFDPAYARSGTELVYARSRPNEPACSLVVYDIQSHKSHIIAHGNAVCDRTPSFSPDGSRIVFARACRYRPYSFGGFTWDMWDIYTVRSDGANLTRITNQSYYSASSPHFSSDGKWICYSAEQFNQNPVGSRIYIVAASLGALPIRFGAGISDSDSEYSPDGHRILFTSDVTGSQHYDIMESNVAGGKAFGFGVVKQSAYNTHPHYTSDGNTVYFLADPKVENRTRLRLWRLDRRSRSAVEFAGPGLFETPLQYVGH